MYNMLDKTQTKCLIQPKQRDKQTRSKYADIATSYLFSAVNVFTCCDHTFVSRLYNRELVKTHARMLHFEGTLFIIIIANAEHVTSVRDNLRL